MIPKDAWEFLGVAGAGELRALRGTSEAADCGLRSPRGPWRAPEGAGQPS